MKTYLVTGVAGFIGSALAHKLILDGHKVIGVDNLLTGLFENIPKEVVFFEFDITNFTQFEKLNEHTFDAVLHLAAQTSGEISFEDPDKDLQINVLGTLNVLRYCKTNGITRLLYASSATVYGDSDVNPIPVTQSTQPKSYYGITKLAGEHYARIFSSDIDTTILRMFNVYGPGQNMENIKQGMVSIYLHYLAQGEPILVKGSGDRFRDFIYIDDVVSAWIAAINAERTFGKTYNLSAGTRTTVGELIGLLTSAWGNPDHSVTYTTGTPGDAMGSRGDIVSTKEDLQWSPEVGMEEGIEKTVAWIKEEK
ncbi:MAG: UDP-glucose 4-epimerase [Acidimicrobiales bacterium]|jgi:UDP-glucose 4-epimerase